MFVYFGSFVSLFLQCNQSSMQISNNRINIIKARTQIMKKYNFTKLSGRLAREGKLIGEIGPNG